MSERRAAYRTKQPSPAATGVNSGRLEPIRLVLPLPPSANNLYATVNGNRVKSRAGRDYEWQTANRIVVGGLLDRLKGHRGALSLTIRLFLQHDRDVDGCKALQDALATALGFNDRIITRLVVTKERDAANPRAEVLLEELEP